jgi:hypothetical protein
MCPGKGRHSGSAAETAPAAVSWVEEFVAGGGHVVPRIHIGNFLEGDIIVARMDDHYAIGRIDTDDGNEEHLASKLDRAEALALACTLAGPAHRVFCYDAAGSATFELVDCNRRFARSADADQLMRCSLRRP